MTKDVVIDTRCPVITIYLIPKGDRYVWSSGNNYGNFIGTARVRMNETVISGKRTVSEVLKIMNTMNLRAKEELKPGMILE
jgi:hypothetical protein